MALTAWMVIVAWIPDGWMESLLQREWATLRHLQPLEPVRFSKTMVDYGISTHVLVMSVVLIFPILKCKAVGSIPAEILMAVQLASSLMPCAAFMY